MLEGSTREAAAGANEHGPFLSKQELCTEDDGDPLFCYS